MCFTARQTQVLNLTLTLNRDVTLGWIQISLSFSFLIWKMEINKPTSAHMVVVRIGRDAVTVTRNPVTSG